MVIYFFLSLVSGQIQEIQEIREIEEIEADAIIAKSIIAHPLCSIFVRLIVSGVLLWLFWYLKRTLNKMKDVEIIAKSKERSQKEKERLIELYIKEYT